MEIDIRRIQEEAGKLSLASTKSKRIPFTSTISSKSKQEAMAPSCMALAQLPSKDFIELKTARNLLDIIKIQDAFMIVVNAKKQVLKSKMEKLSPSRLTPRCGR